jgi:hypothetical protein
MLQNRTPTPQRSQRLKRAKLRQRLRQLQLQLLPKLPRLSPMALGRTHTTGISLMTSILMTYGIVTCSLGVRHKQQQVFHHSARHQNLTVPKIHEETGASVSTKGTWYPDRSKATERDPPLYLHIAATTPEMLQKAIGKVNELINMDLGSLVEEKKDRRGERVRTLIPPCNFFSWLFTA